jgi:hypothetical protein
MKALILSPAILFAIIGAPSTTAAADAALPKIGSEKLCKARAAGDKMMKFAELQSVADCIQEENDAKQRLGPVWSATGATIRTRCKADAVALGTLGYVDLLTCIQTEQDLKSQSSGTKSPGGPSSGK